MTVMILLSVTIAEAIAIQGDKILEVGTNAQIRALVADWTEVIDAKGEYGYSWIYRYP